MTHEQAELVRQALGGSWEADHGTTAAICLQAADELDVIEQALQHGVNDNLVASCLTSLAIRLRAAARLVGAIDSALDNEKPEAAQ